MKGAGRRWLAAIADVTIGPDEVEAFALGAITVMERALGIENKASTQVRI